MEAEASPYRRSEATRRRDQGESLSEITDSEKS